MKDLINYNVNEKFAERIKELRKRERLTQDELAKILNVNKTTVSNWEKRIKIPRAKIIYQIVKFFMVSADYLLGLKD